MRLDRKIYASWLNWNAVDAARESGVDNSHEIEMLSKSVIALYTRAREVDPRNHKAAYGLAQYLNRLDADQNAEQVLGYLLQTIEIKPDHFWALNDLGAMYIRDGEFKSAEDYLTRDADIESTSIVLYTKAQGADDAWLVEDGYVTEGTSNNAYIVTKDGTLITRNLSTDILHGITRASVLKLAAEADVV